MKFERPEAAAIKKEAEEARKEKPELVEKYLKELDGLLKLEAGKLEKQGFQLNPDCRINSRSYSDIVSEDIINKDMLRVQQLEAEFNKKSTPQDVINKNIGELLEKVKTLSINREFNNQLISVRTNKYDDYVNGVDNLIVDVETNHILAAIDDSTNRLKMDDPRVEQRIQEGARVRYGFEYKNNKADKKSLEKIPVFIISTDLNGVLALAKDTVNQKSSLDGMQAINTVIGNLVDQAEKIESGEIKISDPRLKESYKKAGEIFGKL